MVTAIYSQGGWWMILLGGVQYIPTFTLIPRFILNLRELYASDLRGRREGDIDTAFGLASSFGHGGAMSAMMFAEAGQNEDEGQGREQHEELQMEERVLEVRNARSSA